jgi:hypothetical protein
MQSQDGMTARTMQMNTTLPSGRSLRDLLRDETVPLVVQFTQYLIVRAAHSKNDAERGNVRQ